MFCESLSSLRGLHHVQFAHGRFLLKLFTKAGMDNAARHRRHRPFDNADNNPSTIYANFAGTHRQSNQSPDSFSRQRQRPGNLLGTNRR